MQPRRVVVIDTSVVCRLIGIDGEEESRSILEEMEERRKRGEQFMLPTTALIEAGNRIAQAPGRRREMAEKLVRVIEAAKVQTPPWVIPATRWDEQHLEALVAGDSTGQKLVDLLAAGSLGTGDVALLVERDEFKRRVAHIEVGIWTLDDELRAHG